jgi:tetratricopeptide (TPR) repeat protein
VAKLITSVWKFQQDNPDRQVSGAMLTSSGIGKEKELTFPGGVPGLIYWRTAARAGADVEPIRTALLCLDLSKDLQAFIRDATPSELRAKILQPIQWLGGGPSPEELRKDVEDRLINLGLRMGVPAASARNARDSLIATLLDTVLEPAEIRYVTKAELIKVFQSKTFVMVPPDFLQGLAIGGAGTTLTPVEAIARDVAQIPLSRHATDRSAVIGQLQADLVSTGALWFHGSSGLGKSTLAVLLAQSQSAPWRLVDLRELSEAAACSTLIGIASSFRQTRAVGLILDDMPADPGNALISAVGQVARAAADADAVLVITSMKPPPPTLAGRLGLGTSEIISVPYLTEEDVADMVRRAGGDPQKWARPIHAFAGSGHPQLVDARIAGLAQRGWNEKEILADIIPFKGAPDDMAAERLNVRNRLLQELRSDESELLLRLSLLLGNFDRGMALVVAGTPTAIAKPGMVFDFLVGPWIEQVGLERYRLSPLLKDSGAAGLSAPLQRSVKSDVMTHLMGQRPFPADQLLQVFTAAIQLDDREALSWFGHVVLAASTKEKKSRFRRLAQGISVFALFDRGEGNLLIPGDTQLSTLLRFAQLRVAIATDDIKRAAILIDRALAENDELDAPRKRMLNAMIYTMVMLEPRIPIPAKRWLSMFQELVTTPEMRDIFNVALATQGEIAGLPPTATHEEMLFIIRATASKSVTELAELIDALDQQPKDVRSRYLGAAARTNQSLHLIVAASWLAEVKRRGFDARAAAATFRRLSQFTAAKENADLAVELLCAEAIMLDEYADDEDGALDVLRVAQEHYPNDYRLNRQRQKVFYRHGKHAEALAEFEKFKDRLPKDRAVDRAYAMREAGKSAAEIGELPRALKFFGEAWESAKVCGDAMKIMTAGLSADCAIVAFDVGEKNQAVTLMRRALTEGDGLDPKAGLKEAYLKSVQIAAVLYMRGAAADFPVARQARVYGMCSDPDPNEWFRNRPQAQRNFAWYELAELEAEVTDSHVVLDELRRRTQSGGLLPLETMLSSRVTDAAIRHLDPDRFLEALKTYPRAVVVGVKTFLTGVGDPLNMPEGQLASITEAEWTTADIAATTRSAVMAFMLTAAAAGREDILTTLRQKSDAVPGLRDVVRPLFETMDDPSSVEKDLEVIIPSIAGRLLKDDIVDTVDVFMSAVYTLQFLEGSVLAGPVADALMKVYERLWPEILEKRTFSMISPSTNGPLIIEALRKGETAKQRMAHMVLAAEAAVKRNLNDDLRAKIKKISLPQVKPVVEHDE